MLGKTGCVFAMHLRCVLFGVLPNADGGERAGVEHSDDHSIKLLIVAIVLALLVHASPTTKNTIYFS